MMIDRDISKQVLTVGADWKRPAGGVAQVMANFAQYLFGTGNFNCIINSCRGNKLKKIIRAASSYIAFLIQLATNRQVKIIHIHTASYNSFKRSAYFVRLAKRFNKKVILHIHGGGFKEYYATNPLWVNTQLSKADWIVALSPSWYKFFESILPQHKISIINNPVPMPSIGTDHTAGKDNKLVSLLFLGAINNEKGIFDLIEVINDNIKILNNRLQLHIGGNGDIERLKRAIADSRLNNIVTFHGWVSGDLKKELFRQCDYFILPSYTEGLPLSIIEAMSYGLPVISTKVGGIPEIVDKNTGYLFIPGDKDAMLEILKTITSDNSKYSEQSTRAIDIASKFSPDAVSAQLSEVYINLLS